MLDHASQALLCTDFAMAKPRFNIKEGCEGKLQGNPQWSRSKAETAPDAIFYKKRSKDGTPPQGDANFAWVQHRLHHLAPNGSMALLLANGSMSSDSSGEGDIRRALIEADLVEGMVALPGQYLYRSQIPVCLLLLEKCKAAENSCPQSCEVRIASSRKSSDIFEGVTFDRIENSKLAA